MNFFKWTSKTIYIFKRPYLLPCHYEPIGTSDDPSYRYAWKYMIFCIYHCRVRTLGGFTPILRLKIFCEHWARYLHGCEAAELLTQMELTKQLLLPRCYCLIKIDTDKSAKWLYLYTIQYFSIFFIHIWGLEKVNHLLPIFFIACTSTDLTVTCNWINSADERIIKNS